MAYVNKTSLRDEFEHLKSEFHTLSSTNKLTPESRALIQAMIVLFDVLVAIFLEKNTRKTTDNSSKPSSQMARDESSTVVAGAKGKGKRENGEPFANARTRETVKIAKVSFCDTCGEDLSQLPSDRPERRTKVDIVFEKVVLHVDAESKACPACQAVTRGRFPSDMKGPLQYGEGVKAYVLNLVIAQMISLNRVQKSIQTLIGMMISEATILKYVLQLHRALEGWERAGIERLFSRPCMWTRPRCV